MRFWLVKILRFKGHLILWSAALLSLFWLLLVLAFELIASRPNALYSLASMANAQLSMGHFDAKARPFASAVDIEIWDVDLRWEGHHLTMDSVSGDVNLWNLIMPDLAVGKKIAIEGLRLTIQSNEDSGLVGQNPLASPWLRFWEDTRVDGAQVIWQSDAPWMLDKIDLHVFKTDHWQSDMGAVLHYPGWVDMPVTASASIDHAFGFHPKVNFEAKVTPGQMTLLGQFYDFRFDVKGLWDADALVGDLTVEVYDADVSGPSAVSHVLGQVRSEDLLTWDVHIQQLQVGGKAVALPVWPQLTLNPQRGALIQLSQVQLSPQGEWLTAMPEEVQAIWHRWQPEIWLKQLALQWSPEGRLETIRGGIDVLRWAANGIVPGLDMRQLTFDYLPNKGLLQVVPQGGSDLRWQSVNGHQHIIKAQPLVLHVNPNAPFDEWSLPSWQVNIGKAVLTLAVDSKKDQADRLDIRVGGDQISDVVSLLPMASFSEPLQRWLTHAFDAGANPVIQAHYQGEWSELLAGNLTAPAFSMTGSVQNVRLKFDSAYPMLTDADVHLTWQAQGLLIESEQASMVGAHLNKVRAEVLYLPNERVALRVNGNYQATLAQAKQLLLQSPIATDIGLEDTLKHSELSGRVDGKLSLWIPLDIDALASDVKVLGVARVSDASIEHESLALSDVKGAVVFSESRIEAPQMTAHWLGGDVKGRISQTVSQVLRLSMNGTTPVDVPAVAQGVVKWRADGQLSMTGALKVKVLAQASELAVLLPAPLGREKTDKHDVQLSFDSIDNKVNVDVQDDRWKVRAALMKQETGRWGVQNINLAPVNDKLTLAENNSHLPEINVSQWLSWLTGLPTAESGLALPHNGVVVIDRMVIADQSSLNNTLMWSRPEQGWRVDIRGEAMQGWWQQQASGSRLHFDKLRWQRRPLSAAEKLTEPLPICAAPDVTPWSTLSIDVDQLQLETIRPEGVQITPLIGVKGVLSQQGTTRSLKSLSFKHQSLVGEGGWTWYTDVNRSSLYLQVKADKAEHAAALLGMASMVEGGDIQVNSTMNWAGGFDCYDTRLIEGNLTLNANNGTLSETSPGLARLFGLLSFDAFTRRLKLGLSDVLSRGLAYDEVRITSKLNKGLLQLEQMSLNGPSVRMSMTGSTDLIAEEHQLNAKVTPLIGDSIPTMALLSGVSPITAIGVYLLQKIVPPLSGNILEFDYRINGSWQDPQLNESEAK